MSTPSSSAGSTGTTSASHAGISVPASTGTVTTPVLLVMSGAAPRTSPVTSPVIVMSGAAPMMSSTPSGSGAPYPSVASVAGAVGTTAVFASGGGTVVLGRSPGTAL